MATQPNVLDTSPTTDPLVHIREVEARVLAGAAARINEQVERAKQHGLIDDHGNLLVSDLPEDMQSGAKHDFGG